MTTAPAFGVKEDAPRPEHQDPEPKPFLDLIEVDGEGDLLDDDLAGELGDGHAEATRPSVLDLEIEVVSGKTCPNCEPDKFRRSPGGRPDAADSLERCSHEKTRPRRTPDQLRRRRIVACGASIPFRQPHHRHTTQKGSTLTEPTYIPSQVPDRFEPPLWPVTAAASDDLHEAYFFKYADVMRGRRLRDPEEISDLRHRELAVRHRQDPNSGRVSDGVTNGCESEGVHVS